MPPVPVVIPLYIAEEGEESELAHTSPRTGFSFPAIRMWKMKYRI